MPGSKDGRKSRTFGTQTREAGSARERDGHDKGVQVGTYPERAEMSKSVKAQKDMFPNIKRAKSEVFLFMRGRKDVIRTLQNAFVLEKRGVESFGGKLIGISDNIIRYEGDCYSDQPEQYIVIIKFDSKDNARRWTEHSHKFKQKDFPGPADEVEMFTVPIHYLPLDDLTAFQLTEMYGMMVEPSEFNQNYVNQVCPMLNKRHIYHGVVATNQVEGLRKCQIKKETYVLVNCAKSLADLKEFYYSDEYAQCKEYRQSSMARNDTCFFTIRPL